MLQLPEKGKGWATANNSYIQGTLPIDYKGGKAAQMKTGIQKVPIIDHDLIAAGTLYTGYFQLKLDFENPRSMTNFGIPFNVRVKAVEFDAQYIAGSQLQQSIKNDKGKYRIQNIEGYDEGQAWVEVLHWSGEGRFTLSMENPLKDLRFYVAKSYYSMVPIKNIIMGQIFSSC